MSKRETYRTSELAENNGLAQKVLDQPVVNNIEFIVDTEFVSKRTYERCVFRLESKGSIKFVNVHLINCSFNGSVLSEDLESELQSLRLINCKFNKVSFRSKFASIRIEGCNESYVIIDNSDTDNYQITNSTFYNSNFFGKCSDLHLTNVDFRIKMVVKYPLRNLITFIRTNFIRTHSIWDKEITHNANCNKITFDKVSVNPFYLITKCSDKSGIDLSNAKLIDNWSKLRKSYSGLSLTIIFLLTLIFFLPLFLKYFIISSTADLTQSDFLHKTTNVVPFWRVMLYGGQEDFLGFLHVVLTVILLSYNTIRLILTISIARLREEEKFMGDAGFENPAIHPDKLKIHVKAHRVLNYMFYIVVIYSVIKFFQAMQVEVLDISTIDVKDILNEVKGSITP